MRVLVCSQLFYLFEDFNSSVLSKILQTIVNCTIILSATSLTVESLPKYRYPNYGNQEVALARAPCTDARARILPTFPHAHSRTHAP